MTNRETAMEYLRYFCAGDIDRMELLFATDFEFEGPFHAYSTATEYLQGLRSDPPELSRYRVLSVTENEDSVAVFYEYEKPGKILRIAQLFKFRNNKICRLLLVFDGRDKA